MDLRLTWLQIAAMLTVALLTVILPVCVMLLLRRRGGKWRTFLIGALTFFLSAMVLEQLLHTAVMLSPLGETIQGNIWLYALYGGLAAGLFEETGRLAAFRFLLKKETAPVTALAYGAGHGGIEAALVVGVTMISNIALVTMVGNGAVTDPAVTEMAAAVAANPAGMFLWAGFERCTAILLHITNSVLVFAAVRQKRYLLYGLAILLHAGLNMLAVILNTVCPVAVTELLILAFAVSAAFLTRALTKNLTFPQVEGIQ